MRNRYLIQEDYFDDDKSGEFDDTTEDDSSAVDNDDSDVDNDDSAVDDDDSSENVSSDDDIDDNITEDPQTIDDFFKMLETNDMRNGWFTTVCYLSYSFTVRKTADASKTYQKRFQEVLDNVDPYFHNTEWYKKLENMASNWVKARGTRGVRNPVTAVFKITKYTFPWLDYNTYRKKVEQMNAEMDAAGIPVNHRKSYYFDKSYKEWLLKGRTDAHGKPVYTSQGEQKLAFTFLFDANTQNAVTQKEYYYYIGDDGNIYRMPNSVVTELTSAGSSFGPSKKSTRTKKQPQEVQESYEVFESDTNLGRKLNKLWETSYGSNAEIDKYILSYVPHGKDMRQALGYEEPDPVPTPEPVVGPEDTDEYVYIRGKEFVDGWKLIRRYRKDPDDKTPLLNTLAANFINENGDLISDDWYVNAKDFSEKMAPVEWNQGDWTFINSDGDWVRKVSWDEVYQFHDGKARVKAADGYNFVDKNLYSISPVWFDDATDIEYQMTNGTGVYVAKVKSDYFEGRAKINYMDSHGNLYYSLNDVTPYSNVSKLSIPQPPVEPPVVASGTTSGVTSGLTSGTTLPVTAEEETAKEEAEDAFEEIVSLEDAIGSADNEDDEQEQITNALLKTQQASNNIQSELERIRKNYSFKTFLLKNIIYMNAAVKSKDGRQVSRFNWINEQLTNTVCANIAPQRVTQRRLYSLIMGSKDAALYEQIKNNKNIPLLEQIIRKIWLD